MGIIYHHKTKFEILHNQFQLTEPTLNSSLFFPPFHQDIQRSTKNAKFAPVSEWYGTKY